MKATFSIRSSIVISTALVLAFLALGVRQQSRIQTLHEENQSLERKLAATGEPQRGGPVMRSRTRIDHSAEARRAMSELAGLSIGENEGETDWDHRANLADRIQAMNAAGLRAAVAWILETDELDPKFRRNLLFNFLNRLAEDHPVEVIDRITGLEADPPPWFEGNPLPDLLQLAVRRWAMVQPVAAWDWTQEHVRGLDETNRQRWRAFVFQGIARKDPDLLLRLASEEGIDGSGFLVWPDQTAEEKLASFTALRQWHLNNEEGRAAYREAIQKLMLYHTYGRPATFAESTGWLERAGLPPEDIRFVTDRSILDLSYFIDPVETGKWIDWLWRTFPEDWTRRRIDGLFEDSRTGAAARAWLAGQPEDRARRIRGDAGSANEVR
jgi:hypothetical protein